LGNREEIRVESPDLPTNSADSLYFFVDFW